VQLAEALSHETPSGTLPEGRADALMIAAQEQSINRERIDEALSSISPRYRTAIELRLIEELPREECARRMEVTTATFDVVLYRAVRAFRKSFGTRDSQ
jgi:RNA polymerase sigma-70 factor (ECF subfamily)